MNQNATPNDGLAVLVTVASVFLAVVLVIMVAARLKHARDVEYYTRPKRICSACGTVAKPDLKTPGDWFTALMLYLVALVPGIFYSLWRQTHRKMICPSCGAADPIPLTSPRGQELLKKYQPAMQTHPQAYENSAS